MQSYPLSLPALVAVLALWSFTPLSGQFYPIELQSLSRSGGQAGTEFDVRVESGTRVDEVQQLHFSDPRISAELHTLDPLPFAEERRPDFGHFRVRLAADTPPGRYEVRAVGRHGVSNPRYFLVTSNAHLAPSSVSHQQDAAIELPVDQMFHARSTAGELDYFALTLQAGQQVRIELLAQRLDSAMIGHLTLLDPSGRIVATARGSDRTDPILEFTAPEAGVFVLVVRDFLYRGGNPFFYQLVALTGEPGDLRIAEDLPASVSVPAAERTRIEEQPLHSFHPPAAFAARFESRQDEDVYEFAAEQGDQYAIEVVSHRAGEPSDPRLLVLQGQPQPAGDPVFRQVLAADDSQDVGRSDLSLYSMDPITMFTAPAAGTYRIVVQDLDRGETLGERQGYTLLLREPDPGFRLVAYRPFPHNDINQSKPFGSNLFRGGAESVRVVALRQDGWTGPIELAVRNLPAGIHAAPVTIAPSQSAGQITLIADEEAPAWSGEIEVVGTGVIDGENVSVVARPAAICSAAGHARQFIESRLCEDLRISVNGHDLAPLSIEFDQGESLEVKKGASAELSVKLNRREGGDANCILRPRDLPPGVTVNEVTIAADKSEATVKLTVKPDAPVGVYSLWWQGETQVKLKMNPEAVVRARQYHEHLQTLQEDPAHTDQRDAIQAAIKVADTKWAEARNAAKEQQVTVFLPSPNLTIEIVD